MGFLKTLPSQEELQNRIDHPVIDACLGNMNMLLRSSGLNRQSVAGMVDGLLVELTSDRTLRSRVASRVRALFLVESEKCQNL